MEIEKLIAAVKLCGSSPRVDQCRECAYWAGGDMSQCIPRMTADAATALEQLQTENDRLKEMVSFYCDMCIEQDGVLWCQSCDEKCDYCIYPKEE